MKGRSLSILGIVAATVGAGFIVACSLVDMKLLAVICGTLFLASALIDLIIYGVAPGRGDRYTMPFLSSAAAITLGVTMLAYAEEFVPIMPFMLSMLIGACALWQFVTLGLATRPFTLPAWLYAFPLLLTAGAVYLFIIKDGGDDKLMLISTGIILAIFGAGCIIEGSVLGMARRRRNKEAAAIADTTDTTDNGDTPGATDKDTTPTGDTDKPKRRNETTEDLDDEVE